MKKIKLLNFALTCTITISGILGFTSSSSAETYTVQSGDVLSKQGTTIQKANAVLNLADNYIGTPYKLGARGIFTSSFTGKTFDCSSFTQAALWKGAGVKVNRGARGQWNTPGGTIVSKGKWRKGDLIFTATGATYKKYSRKDYRFIGHVGIFYGYGEIKGKYRVDMNSSIKRPIILHTYSPSSGGVRFDYLDNTWLEKGYFGAKRFIQ